MDQKAKFGTINMTINHVSTYVAEVQKDDALCDMICDMMHMHTR
jgi:hypothetical protein